jgi:6,7-dimethyl-8-ribityllumazine synthase
VRVQNSKRLNREEHMAKTHEGHLVGKGLKFAIVVSRFNELITKRLVSGALDGLKRHGVAEDDIEIAWTPGGMEIPLVAKALAESGKFEAVICLAAVIRGGTPHFEYVASQLSRGIAAVSLETGVPVIYGVITAETLEQAIERAGTKAGNRGFDAALSAIEMANLMQGLSKPGSAARARPKGR